jgi:hypothetical protein
MKKRKRTGGVVTVLAAATFHRVCRSRAPPNPASWNRMREEKCAVSSGSIKAAMGGSIGVAIDTRLLEQDA